MEREEELLREKKKKKKMKSNKLNSPDNLDKSKIEQMRFEVKEKVKIRIQEVLNLEVEKVRRQKEVTIPKINF